LETWSELEIAQSGRMSGNKQGVNTLDAKMKGRSKTRTPATDRFRSLHVEGKGRKKFGGGNVMAFGQK
jgi:hypothetical protein